MFKHMNSSPENLRPKCKAYQEKSKDFEAEFFLNRMNSALSDMDSQMISFRGNFGRSSDLSNTQFEEEENSSILDGRSTIIEFKEILALLN